MVNGLPGVPEQPKVAAMPHQEMMGKVCANLQEESKRMLAQYERCALDTAVQHEKCNQFKPDPQPYEQGSHQSGLVAAYTIEQHWIIYHDDLNLGSDADNSFIVHEFVHALHDAYCAGSLFASCAGVIAAEQEAYAVQPRYLHSRGQLLRVGERLGWLAAKEYVDRKKKHLLAVQRLAPCAG